MTTILTALADQDVYREPGGTVLMRPGRLVVEREMKDNEGTRWMYCTEIEITVTRRELR